MSIQRTLVEPTTPIGIDHESDRDESNQAIDPADLDKSIYVVGLVYDSALAGVQGYVGSVANLVACYSNLHFFPIDVRVYQEYSELAGNLQTCFFTIEDDQQNQVYFGEAPVNMNEIEILFSEIGLI